MRLLRLPRLLGSARYQQTPPPPTHRTNNTTQTHAPNNTQTQQQQRPRHKTGAIGYAAYAPSKFAVRGLLETLRNELQGTGVKVSICYPPDMDTPGYEREGRTKVSGLRMRRGVRVPCGSLCVCATAPGVRART